MSIWAFGKPITVLFSSTNYSFYASHGYIVCDKIRIFAVDNSFFMNVTRYIIVYAALNVVTFFIYGIDKLSAKKRLAQVSDITLLKLAILGCSFGAYLAMLVFRHKTQQATFRYGVPLALFFHIVFVGWLAYRKMQQGL